MWNDTDRPLAYFISFRTYGTWLHGDPRGSTSRHRNIFGTKFLPPEPAWLEINRSRLAEKPLLLSKDQRKCVTNAIRDCCKRRGWDLYAVNVRSNHGHTVVANPGRKPDGILNAFKANATRAMREADLYHRSRTPWADKGSERWLWTKAQVDAAIDYVLYCQGDDFLSQE